MPSLKSLAFAAALSLFSACGKSSQESPQFCDTYLDYNPTPRTYREVDPIIKESCTGFADMVATEINGVSFTLPQVYQTPVEVYFRFISERVAPYHPRLPLLEEVIFYRLTDECQERFENAGKAQELKRLKWSTGSTDSVNYILINNNLHAFRKNSHGQNVREEISFFGRPFADSGADHTLGHEIGHVLLDEILLAMDEEQVNELAPPSRYCLSGRKHRLIDRYGFFVEMKYMVEHPQEFETNPFFKEDLLPYLGKRLREHPEEIARIKREISSWDNVMTFILGQEKDYHDKQLDFFRGVGALSSAEKLRYNAIVPVLREIVRKQQENALQKLDELKGRLP